MVYYIIISYTLPVLYLPSPVHSILIYISQSSSPKYLTPHVLSDGNVEWCSLYLYRVVFEHLTSGVILLYITIIHIIHYTYTIIILYIILYSPLLLFPLLPSPLPSSLLLSIIPRILVGTWIHLFIFPIRQSDPACFIGVDG